MAFFPFSIADIDDPEQIRVVICTNGKTGYVPLKVLLRLAAQDISRFDKEQTTNITEISQRVDTLEQQLEQFSKIFKISNN
ncbi:hypothetical protein [Bartonella sp. CB169]|uniref:hypothetical protein n=1 Tax=Bartonella sp. CB169 TaxID=3112257 RepID=UPI00300DE9C0